MALLTWVVAPTITFWLLMIASMAVYCIFGDLIPRAQHAALRGPWWSAIHQRTWLQTPRDPWTDQPNRRLYWWLLPLMVFDGLVAIVLAGYLDAPLTWLFPALKPAPFMEMSQLASREFQGAW